jgi:hypothetical protein
MAIWDAVAKIAGKPLFRLLAERHGVAADPRVFVYAAGGDYYPGKEVEGLRAEMRSYLRKRIEVVLMEIRSDPRAVLSGADGNGREPLQPSGCTQPGALWGDAAGSRLAAV